MDNKILRCNHITCKKKIHLIKFDCDCEKSFCIKHYNKHSHNCPIIIDNKRIIKHNNPIIKPSTLVKV